MKNHIIISLLILLVGCSKESVEYSKLQNRGGLLYKINTEEPYSGLSFELYENGQKEWDGTYKDGKGDGLYTMWYENGQKQSDGTWKDGNMIPSKEWNEDGSVKEWIE